MFEDFSMQPSLTLRVVYTDLPDLLEIETRVRIGEWSGLGMAYASPSELRKSANNLKAWCAHPSGIIEVEAGWQNSTGWLHLAFHTVDLAGHVVCEVQLATSAFVHSHEFTRRMSLVIQTEPGLVEQYAIQIEAMCASACGQAVLRGVT